MLLVEDDVLNRKVMVEIFKTYGISYRVASSGEESIQKTKKERPDIVLMDLHMPDMDGIEATQKIRQLGTKKYIPVYALTADVFLKNNQKELPFDGYITKPIEFDYLLAILEKHLVS